MGKPTFDLLYCQQTGDCLLALQVVNEGIEL